MAENASCVATSAVQHKIVKNQLVFIILLVTPNSLVRRTIGIVAQNAWCKFEKFRSRITLAKSCSHVGKRPTVLKPSVSLGTCGKKLRSCEPAAASTKHILDVSKRQIRVPAEEIQCFSSIGSLVMCARDRRRGGRIAPDTLLLIIGVEEN